MTSSDLETIPKLALRIAEKAASIENQRVREMWMRHNALQKTVPPVFCRPASSAIWEIVHPPVATDPIERRIEGWYNPHRRHSALNYESPMNFKRLHSPALRTESARPSTERGELQSQVSGVLPWFPSTEHARSGPGRKHTSAGGAAQLAAALRDQGVDQDESNER